MTPGVPIVGAYDPASPARSNAQSGAELAPRSVTTPRQLPIEGVFYEVTSNGNSLQNDVILSEEPG